MDYDHTNTAIKSPRPSDYMHMLEGEDLTDEQKLEFLETLFKIMQAFVEMGFSSEPVNKLIEDFENCASESADLISSEHTEHNTKPNTEPSTEKGGSYK